MKKLIFLLGLILVYSCSTPLIGEVEVEDPNNSADRIVEFEFFSSETNYDEVVVSYYDYKTNAEILNVYPFHDINGNSIPVKIKLENYDFRYIRGEGYRNNHSTAELSVKVYVNGELVAEDSDEGTTSTFATVKFDYTVPK